MIMVLMDAKLELTEMIHLWDRIYIRKEVKRYCSPE
jgi:hypothetical protein